MCMHAYYMPCKYYMSTTVTCGTYTGELQVSFLLTHHSFSLAHLAQTEAYQIFLPPLESDSLSPEKQHKHQYNTTAT